MALVGARHGIEAPVVALTFDDGPSQWTEPIADALERHHGRATFFALDDAIEAEQRRATLRRLVATGHEVGNHTWSHPDLRTLADDEIRDELSPADTRLEEVLGAKPLYWRAPFLRCDERVRAAVGELGGDKVWYSLMPGDWELPAP